MVKYFSHLDVLGDILTTIFKVLILGDSGVGKTTSVSRFTEEKVIQAEKTVGVDMLLKNVKVNAKKSKTFEVGLQLWDFSGEPQFRDILHNYSAGTHGVIFMFDSTNIETLHNLKEWHRNVDYSLSQDIPKLLVSSKHDLKESNLKNDVLQDHMNQFKYNDYYPTSSFTGENIDVVYQRMSSLIETRLAFYEFLKK
ncbi:MAG: Rab family GTPase [Candidatus Hodarchaeales archaeon]|jgi:small GTP-binding protein